MPRPVANSFLDMAVITKYTQGECAGLAYELAQKYGYEACKFDCDIHCAVYVGSDHQFVMDVTGIWTVSEFREFWSPFFSHHDSKLVSGLDECWQGDYAATKIIASMLHALAQHHLVEGTIR